jgi:hypothetical protein
MTDADTPLGNEEPSTDDTEAEATVSRLRAWMLVLGALGIIAVPSLIGYSMINRGGDDDDSQDMGGGMGSPSATEAPGAAPGGVLDLMTIVDADGVRVEVHGDGTATVFVTTTIDVACAVSYGPTRELGSIATDTDMAGGGHRVHHPLLVNLDENTDYFYKINAIGPSGELYTLPIRSFTNGAGSSAAPGPNLASGATVVDVSSEYSERFAAGFAFDGDRTTEWSSRGDGDDAYVVVDMGSTVDLTGIGFRTREMSDGTSITTSFTVTIDDGAPLGPFDAGVGLAVAEFAASGRVIRIDVETSTGGNTGAVEIEIYGTDGDAAPPAPTAPPATTGAPDTPGTAAPATGAPTAPAPNVARGASITGVSSEFSDAFAARYAVDGDLSTEWASAGDGDDAYIVIDLGEEIEIFGVGFRTREMADGTSITTSFTVSVDGGPPLGPFPAGPGLVIAEFSELGGSVRIDVETSTGGNTGAVEIEVYGFPTM